MNKDSCSKTGAQVWQSEAELRQEAWSRSVPGAHEAFRRSDVHVIVLLLVRLALQRRLLARRLLHLQRRLAQSVLLHRGCRLR